MCVSVCLCVGGGGGGGGGGARVRVQMFKILKSFSKLSKLYKLRVIKLKFRARMH